MARETVAEGSALTGSSGACRDAQTFENEGVRVRSVENCLLCGLQGQPLYTGFRDRLFEAPGVWALFRCSNCSLVWLNPRPLPEDIGKLYKGYYAQNFDPPPVPRRAFRGKLMRAILATKFGYAHLLPSAASRWLGRCAALLPLARDWAGSSVMFLKRGKGSRLADLGCGDGHFLAVMQDLGWEVEGLEPDPQAARIASERHGVRVHVGTVEESNLAPESYDAITMCHVIEHLHDPVAALKRCHRSLRPGGSLVVVTPNVASLGHRYFRRCCYHLEPPRHLFLFSMATLRALAVATGFEVEVLRTRSALSRDVYIGSRGIELGSRMSWPHVPSSVDTASWAFLLVEEAIRIVRADVGEELVMLAVKGGMNAGGSA